MENHLVYYTMPRRRMLDCLTNAWYNGGGDTMESVQSTVMVEQSIRKSRFIAYLIPLREDGDLERALLSLKETHPQANHHCYASVEGPTGQFVRYSDDKEPRGTAGLPMLHVLQGAKLTDVLAVVIRYFGGTLLGTGGLVRAYSSTLQEALSRAQRVAKKAVQSYRITISYDDVGSLEGWLRSHALTFVSSYSQQITFEVSINREASELLIETVLAQTKRHAAIEILKESSFYD
jgi:uncharacterized YigZ family protein